jgi:hypothetical protein
MTDAPRRSWRPRDGNLEASFRCYWTNPTKRRKSRGEFPLLLNKSNHDFLVDFFGGCHSQDHWELQKLKRKLLSWSTNCCRNSRESISFLKKLRGFTPYKKIYSRIQGKCEYQRKALDSVSQQNVENVKTIAKLEAECTRLRIALNRKLPSGIFSCLAFDFLWLSVVQVHVVVDQACKVLCW